jgi:hypothetical protein
MNKRNLWIHVVVLAVLLIVAVGPWVLTFVADQILNSNGCSFDESFVQPCVIGGQDRGQLLHSWGNMGYVGIITCPVGFILIALYLIGLGIAWLVRRSRQAKAS